MSKKATIMASAIWAFWFAGLLYSHAMLTLGDWRFAIGWLVAFGPFEALLGSVHPFYTYSWTCTRMGRALSKHRRFGVGWNWVLVVLSGIPVALGFRLLWLAFPGPVGLIFSTIVGLVAWAGLEAHFRDPETHG